jgi:hypothetical protein
MLKLKTNSGFHDLFLKYISKKINWNEIIKKHTKKTSKYHSDPSHYFFKEKFKDSKRDNQKPWIEENQTIQWLTGKWQKDNQYNG